MKKNLLYILIALLLPVFVSAQSNHVPNGSFEYGTCPTGMGQVSQHCTGWYQYTQGGSSDFYNACATASLVKVPLNYTGYQVAADGNKYIGVVCYEPFSVSYYNYKEYAASSIIPLQVGDTYVVSMSVNLANRSRHACNDLGAYFFLNAPTTRGGDTVLGVTPQVSYSNYGPVHDTTDWVRLSQVFVADSAYTHIVIGGFTYYNQLDVDTVDPLGSIIGAYYLIDSVVVQRRDSFRAIATDTVLCAGDTIQVQYLIPGKYNANNVFTTQLSDASGSFNSPVNIGSVATDSMQAITCVIPANTPTGSWYRIRVVASSPADTSEDNGFNIYIGNFPGITATSNTPLCIGDSIKFATTTSASPVTYSWSGPDSFTSASANPVITPAALIHSGNYFLSAKLYGCEIKDTLPVTVGPVPAKPVTASNTPLCAGDTLKLYAATSSAGATYSWTGPASFTSNAQNPVMNGTTTANAGSYIVTAALNGCGRKDTTVVIIHPSPSPINVSSNSPVCEGDTLRLNSTASSTGVTYTWSGPNNFTSTAQNSFIAKCTMAAGGWYKMTVDLNGCTFIDSIQAVIRPNPVLNAPLLSYKKPICVGDTLHLSTPGVAGATYNWTGPGGFSSGLQNPKRPNIQIAEAGIYNLTLAKSDCVSPMGGVYVSVNPQPYVNIITIPADSICDIDSFVFSALSNCHLLSTLYVWYVNNSPVSSGNIATYLSTTLKDKDIVYCRITESTWCQYPFTDESNHIKLSLLPTLTPSVSISATGHIPFVPASPITFTATVVNGGNNPIYKWKLNGQDVTGVNGSVWVTTTMNDNDKVSLEVESSYKCPMPRKVLSNEIRIRTTGMSNMTPGFGKLVLFPNPNNGKFIITASAEMGISDTIALEVVNAYGQVVFNSIVGTVHGGLNAELDLSTIPSGLYLLRLKDKTGNTTSARFTID